MTTDVVEGAAPRTSLSKRVSKRVFDLLCVVGAAWFWVPLISVLLVLVWVFDGRPLFFVQRRAGLGRRPFDILKLRTMTLEDDPAARRPTRFGRFLRDRGFDELPQILNVVRGDMSLVGPRPLTEADARRLVAQHPPFARRFDVPPGLTGLAQVCMARGSEQTARLDSAYAERRSAMLDLAILLRTVWINLVGKARGAKPIPEELRAS